MELTNNNDVLIVLNITDRRGRNIRVAAVKDIKVKVWTRDPECALTFNYRDIIQKMDCDVIAIPSRQMSALPSGIVVYQYFFKGGLHEEPHCKENFYPQIERSHTVTTDIFWKNNHFEDFMKNPTFYNSLDHLKELIERESRERHHQFGDLYHYVTETYTNKLQDEVDRATARENDLEESIDSVSGTVDSKFSELNEKIDAEVKRSTEVDIHFLEIINELDSKTQDGKQEVEDKLDSENKRAEEAEKELQNNLDSEIERAKTEEKRIEEKLDAEIARSKAEDVQTHLEIETETTRAKQEEARIEGRMEAEKARAKEAEKHIQTDVDDEIKRAKGREDELDKKQKELSDAFDTLKDDVKDEIKRSKEFDEKCEETCRKNTEKVDSIDSALNDEIARAKKKEKNIKQQIEDETSRATIAENEIKASIEVVESTHKAELSRIEAKVDAENVRATETEKHIQSDVDDEIARAKAKETEIETLIKNHIAESDDTYKTVTDKLDAEISRATIKENELNAAIEAEVNRAQTEESRIENKVDTNADNIVSETNRAKLVERDITDAVQALKTLVNTKDTELNGSIDGLRSELYAEILRSETEDSNINRLLEILNGDEDTIGSVQHSIKDAEHRINDNIEDLRDEVEEIIGGNLEDYATKVYVDERFQHLIGEAPEALDTLEEIANKLKQDDEIFATLQEILSGKAAKEDVYTKAEIDRKEADLSNSVQTETQRATLAENGLQSQIDSTNSDLTSLTEKVNSHIAEGDSNYQDVNRAIIEEVTRATNAETQLQNSIDVINGDEGTIGSIAHAVSDLGHDFEDRIAALKAESTETLKDYAKQFDLDALIATVNAHTSDADSKYQELNLAVQTESQRATLVENGLQTQIDGLSSDAAALLERVNSHITEGDSYYQELNALIVSETTRATNAENKLQNSIDVINGDEGTIGSIAHGVADSNHYTDDRIAGLQSETAEILKDYAKQIDLDSIISTVSSHINDADSKYAELNNAIIAETTRATNAETINANAIAVINGDIDTIGSINHAVADANHYTDDEIAKLKQSVVMVEDFNAHLAEGALKEAAMNQRIETIETMLQWDEYNF